MLDHLPFNVELRAPWPHFSYSFEDCELHDMKVQHNCSEKSNTALIALELGKSLTGRSKEGVMFLNIRFESF